MQHSPFYTGTVCWGKLLLEVQRKDAKLELRIRITEIFTDYITERALECAFCALVMFKRCIFYSSLAGLYICYFSL